MNQDMDRRDFLVKSSTFLVGSFLGLSGVSNLIASEVEEKDCFSQPAIALIIDDIGFSSFHARQFLELDVSITFSILPRLRNSYDLALEINDEGHEIMLHQPMEPSNPSIDPGPGALYVGYGAEKIADIMERNIGGLPYAIGVNNHMGSKFTQCQKEVKDFISFIKKTGHFFIDSVTTRRSIAHKTAKNLDVNTACRNIFLDNNREEKAILHQLSRIKTIARTHGCAIGIGHPFPETARAIRRFLESPDFLDFSFVHISKLICFTNTKKPLSTNRRGILML
jgi:hypothetical protein